MDTYRHVICAVNYALGVNRDFSMFYFFTPPVRNFTYVLLRP